MKNLVIVESAAKAKTIQKYLNDIPELKKHGSFVVIASFGHICDLPRKELGIDKTKWTAKYDPLDAKANVIKTIEKEIKKADKVWIASDLDMEGEAIANHIKRVFKLERSDYHRITFNEITKTALRDAVLHPRNINMNMVNAQEARRILDRVIGYELSPLLWRRFATSGLSAGRVQSAALKMIIDKEAEVKNHEPEPFWTMNGEFHLAKPKATLTGKTEATLKSNGEVQKLMKQLAKKTCCDWTARFSQRESKRNPSAPFVTSSLQQEAYSRLGLPAKRTMQIAQSLYEAGYITYMRTDSPTLSEAAQNLITGYIREKYGDDHVQLRQFKAKGANAQEAHECIRPTKIADDKRDELDGINRKLYDLIWRRAVASQMSPAIYSEIGYTISTDDGITHVFKGDYDVLLEEGYLKVYNPQLKSNPQDLAKWKDVLAAKDGVPVRAEAFEAKGDVSRPPPLYNEPMLIRTLEKEGIGRPSTYAAILDKLFFRGYVLKGVNPFSKTVHVATYKWKKSDPTAFKEVEETIVIGGSDTDKFVSTSLGERVTEYMNETVPFLLQKKYTADVEKELDEISDGDKSKVSVLNEFYAPFETAIAKADRIAKQEKKKDKQCVKADGANDKNKLREFARLGTSVIQTRYGPALFKQSDNKWVSLMPFMKWRGKTIEDLSERDARFLMSLPVNVGKGNKYMVHMGRYGLYIKDAEGNNYRLAKESWDDVYEGRELDDIKPIPLASAKKRLPKKKAPSAAP